MLKEAEIKALVSLLDDEDAQIVSHVEDKILSLGTPIIPFFGTRMGKQFQFAGSTPYRRVNSHLAV